MALKKRDASEFGRTGQGLENLKKAAHGAATSRGVMQVFIVEIR
jgi:hypothetical protein